MAASLHVEIQNLRDALAASEKKADRYAQMIATLTVELDDLRSGICDCCKKKLVAPRNVVSAPPIMISASQGSITGTAAPVSSRPTTDNIGLSHSPAASLKTNTPLLMPSEPEVAHNLSTSRPTPTSTYHDPNENLISSEQKPKPPQWSVVYHPELERALELHLVHVFMYDSPVYCVKMSPDGQRLAVGPGGEGKIYLHDMQTGSIIRTFVDRYVKDSITIWSVQFSPNGQFLATGAFDGRIRIWMITQKRMRAMLKGHKHAITGIAFSPNGRSLVSASLDRSVWIWNIRDGSSKVLPVTGSPRYFYSVAFSPGGWYVAAGNSDKSLWIWDSRTHRLLAKWWGHSGSVVCTEFTADGKGLISGGLDNTVKYWDVSSLGNRRGASTGTIVNEEQAFPLVRRFLGHNDSIRSIASFPDNNQWIVTCSDDKSVRVWDTESGVCQLTLQGHVGWIRGVDVSQKQDFLAIASHDGCVTVWKYI